MGRQRELMSFNFRRPRSARGRCWCSTANGRWAARHQASSICSTPPRAVPFNDYSSLNDTEQLLGETGQLRCDAPNANAEGKAGKVDGQKRSHGDKSGDDGRLKYVKTTGKD